MIIFLISSINRFVFQCFSCYEWGCRLAVIYYLCSQDWRATMITEIDFYVVWVQVGLGILSVVSLPYLVKTLKILIQIIRNV